MISASDAKIIAASGGGLDIDSAAFSASDLKLIAAGGKAKGAKLIIRNAARIGASDLKIIAASSPGNVIFEF